MRFRGIGLLAIVALLAPSAAGQNVPLDFRFSYQGELRLNNVVVDQASDFQFSLFDQPVGGNQIGSTNNLNNVPVARGVFDVQLDFGNVAFAGDRRHLEIAVRSPAGAGAFTTLTPRVELTPAPNAHYSRFSGIAFNAFELDGLDSTDFVQQGETNSITSAMIVPGNVTQSGLQNGSVSTAKIQAGAVTNNEIAAATITGAKIADGSVTGADLAANSVSSVHIVAGAVGSSEIIANAVGSSEIAANAVLSSHIVDGTVTAADLAGGAIDGGDADTVDGLQGAQFLRADASDIITGGSNWTVSGGAPNSLTFAGANLELNLGDSSADQTTVIGGFAVDGTSVSLNESTNIDVQDTNGDFNSSLTLRNGASGLFTLNLGDSTADTVEVAGFLDVGNILTMKKNGPKRIRMETAAGGLETNFSYEPAPNAWDTTGAFRLGSNSVLTVGAPIGATFTPLSFNSFGGNTTPPGSSDISTQDDLKVDDSLEVGDDIYLGTFSSDPTIYFEAGGSATSNWIRWDDVISGVTCNNVGAVSSGIVNNISNNTNTAWVFQNGSDNELVMHAGGDMEIDGSYYSLGSCDVAETFFGDADIEPGTVVILDPGQAEGVRESRRAYEPTLVGVVSTRPGLLLSGPSSDAYPMFEEMDRARADAGANPDDEALVRRVDDLERALDSWARGEVPVALAGRVPVKVVGAVKMGQPLTSSDVPGHAMGMDRAGPSIGIAMESKSSGGAGTVLVLLQSGWNAPVKAVAEPRREAVANDAGEGDDRVADLERRLAKIETRAGRDGDGRNGRDGRGDAEPGRDGRSGRDARDDRSIDVDRPSTPIVRIEKEAWGDVDGDGLDDVVVLDGEGLTLYRNVGSGGFRDVTPRANLGDVTGTRIALFEDYDLDRHLDLLLVDADGGARLLQGNGTFAFADVTAARGLDLGRPIVEARFLDHDRDGRPDLRVELADGTLLLHHNQGEGAFRTATLRPALSGAGVDAADARVSELEAQVLALTKMVEALAGAKGEE